MNFNNMEKERLLLLHKYQMIEGYMMGYESPESLNVIISVEEIKGCIGKAPTKWFVEEDGESAYDLDDSWEMLFDGIHMNIDAEGDNEVIDHLKKELESNICQCKSRGDRE